MRAQTTVLVNLQVPKGKPGVEAKQFMPFPWDKDRIITRPLSREEREDKWGKVDRYMKKIHDAKHRRT